MSVIIVLFIEHRYNKWGEGGREKAGERGWVIGHGKGGERAGREREDASGGEVGHLESGL